VTLDVDVQAIRDGIEASIQAGGEPVEPSRESIKTCVKIGEASVQIGEASLDRVETGVQAGAQGVASTNTAGEG
jgi:hypothetical protein